MSEGTKTRPTCLRKAKPVKGLKFVGEGLRGKKRARAQNAAPASILLERADIAATLRHIWTQFGIVKYSIPKHFSVV